MPICIAIGEIENIENIIEHMINFKKAIKKDLHIIFSYFNQNQMQTLKDNSSNEINLPFNHKWLKSSIKTDTQDDHEIYFLYCENINYLFINS